MVYDNTKTETRQMILTSTKENIARIVCEVQNGGVCAVPADTVYGLVALASSAKKVYALKGRDKSVPLLYNVPSLAAMKKVAKLSKLEEELVRTYMPGELTLALRVREGLEIPTADDGTIGIRIPSGASIRYVLRKIGEPLISTSANKSGHPPALSAKDTQETFPHLLILDSEENLSGIPSTIAKVEKGKVNILRQGKVKVKVKFLGRATS